MRVLVVSNMYPSPQKPYAGIFVRNQVERLRALGEGAVTVEVFAMPRTFTGIVGSLAKYAAAVVRFLPLLFRRYDVVHVHYFFPLYYPAWLYAVLHPGTRLFVTFHGSDVTRKLAAGPVRWLSRRVIRRADGLIAVGKDLAEGVHAALDRRPDRVLSAGVDRRVFYREPVAPKRYDFIFVGSFIERKGIDLLAGVLEAGRGGRFCFVGSGPWKERLARAAGGGRARVDILENLSQAEIRGLLNASRFFLFPSRDEPFGLVATEALYCGTPAVVTRVGGLAEQVRDGENGFFIAAPEVRAVIDAMDRAEALGEAEYARMSDAAEGSNGQFALDAVCETLLALYRGHEATREGRDGWKREG